MDRFDEFLDHLLRAEGGWSDDPVDPGGATNMGVTLKTFTAVAQRLLDVEPTRENLRKLTRDQAGKIYRELYWDRLGVDRLGERREDAVLAIAYADFFVNAGAHAVRTMQRCLNDAHPAAKPIAVDGVPGPGTLGVLCQCDRHDLYRRLREARIAYYRELADRRPELGKFLNGWLRRVDQLPKPEREGSAP